MDKSELRKKLKKYVYSGDCDDRSRCVNREFPWLKVVDGFYKKEVHTWNVAPDGAVVDVTYSQFNPRIKIGIWEKGSKEYRNYTGRILVDENDKIIDDSRNWSNNYDNLCWDKWD